MTVVPKMRDTLRIPAEVDDDSQVFRPCRHPQLRGSVGRGGSMRASEAVEEVT
jgi:hypothetical protein